MYKKPKRNHPWNSQAKAATERKLAEQSLSATEKDERRLKHRQFVRSIGMGVTAYA